MAKSQGQKFPSEMIELPSGGKLYPKGSPLRDGKIEVKYMTAKEEDILTSQNLVKKGIVLDTVLDSLILTPGIKADNLFMGDRNAVLISARVLAYGPEYTVEIPNPDTGERIKHTFDLTDLPYREVPSDVDYSSNEFEMELPASKVNITFKLLTGIDEKRIENEQQSIAKTGSTRDMTTRLRHLITSVDGNSDKKVINNFVDNMLSRDSYALRSELQRITPDIIMSQEVEIGGDAVEVDIPMTVEFFWPST
tara:strand:+ start:113 stop:865 length:753 start_codon:yes stop_codon:yes gene_type:complete